MLAQIHLNFAYSSTKYAYRPNDLVLALQDGKVMFSLGKIFCTADLSTINARTVTLQIIKQILQHFINNKKAT